MTELFKLFPFQRFTVHEDSMLPVLKPGDDILILKFQKGKTGDIIVAYVKNKYMIKRVSQIKNDQYYLLGDNSNASLDSRHFGPIKRSNILGKIIYISRN